MENESKKCFKCKYLNRYYTKGEKRFNITKCGWCNKKNGIAYIQESCDCYVLKSNNRTRSRPIKCTLSELLTELSAIRCVIEEEMRENNETEQM